MSIVLSELQCWVNGSNILINNDNITSKFAYWDNKDDDVGFYETLSSSDLYNDIIDPAYDTFSPTTDNPQISLIVKGVPSTDINDIQSLVLYNRIHAFLGVRTIGLAIELYNIDNDPNLETPLASTNEITSNDDVYRFDFPAIDTYPSGDFSDTDSITQIASETLALKEVVSEFAESANITGGLKVDTITTTGNVNVGGLVVEPNRPCFCAYSTTSYTKNGRGKY